MTDEQLLALLEQKAPEELTPEEIDILRTRLQESPAIREALAGQLEIDTYLATALARPGKITPEQILARQSSDASFSRLLLLVLLLVIPIVGLSSAVLWNAVSPSISSLPEDAASTTETDENSDKSGESNDPSESPADNKKNNDATDDPDANSPSVTPSPDKNPDTAPQPAPEPPAAPAPPPKPLLPWQKTVDAVGPFPKMSEVSFRDFDTEKKLPLAADLRPWFASVAGSNHRLSETTTNRGRCGQLEGLARLESPWLEDSALRLSLENYNDLQIHFFHAEHGVTLFYYEDQGYRWAAYTSQRDGNKPRPKSQTFALTSTDDDRNRRSEIRQGGPIEIRYRDGQIILSRGDIPLVTAPLPGPPNDVYFDGRCAFYGIQLVRTVDDPVPLHAPPTAITINDPEKLAWQVASPRPDPKPEDLERYQKFLPQPVAGGGVRLSADKPPHRLNYFAPLPQHVLGEVVLELDNVGPGTGVYLARPEGKAHEVLRFLKNRRGDCPLVARQRGWEAEWEAEFHPYAEKPLAAVQPHCFVKLNYGCGTVRWSVSSDGKSWATLEPPNDNLPGEVIGIGLEIPQDTPNTGITIKNIQLREFTGLTQLADKELLAKVPHVGDLPSFAAWQSAMFASQPAGVQLEVWRRTFAVDTLAQGLNNRVAFMVLEGLLDDPALTSLPIDKQLMALSDTAMMTHDLRSDQSMRRGLPRRLIDLALSRLSTDGVGVFEQVSQVGLSFPINSWHQQDNDASELYRQLFCHAVYQSSPAEILSLCDRFRFYHTDEQATLVPWAESVALRSRVDGGGEGLTRLKDGWRHPLMEQLSKDTYSRLTEIQSVIDSQAWEDAARMITAVDPESAPGVAPYFGDRNLLASIPVAIELMLADHPPLREVLSRNFAPLAKLRLAQAMAQGSAPQVELAAVQFSATDSAAEAHQWLGDRALASGWFDRARLQYERARTLNPSLSTTLSPRIRLAAAMLGESAESPVTADVRFGEVSLSAGEFETMIGQMIARGDQGLSPIARPAIEIPAPSSYQVNLRARLDGPVGDRPTEEQGARTNQNRAPWVDLQLDQVVDGNTLFVSNRFQVAAYDLANNGSRLWQSQSPPGPMQAAQKLPGIAFRPLVTSDRILVRMHYGDSPQLCCLEKSSGKLLWNTVAADRQRFISDPLLLQGRLGILGLAPLEQDEAAVQWLVIDPTSGQILSTHELLRIRSVWLARQECEVVADLDQAIVSLGGVVAAFDPRGQVRWMRRQTTMPPEEDSSWILQRFQPPLVDGDLVYVAQPGVRELLALERSSGRLRWSRVLPSLIGISGIAAGKLITEQTTGLLALDLATGAEAWKFEEPRMHPRVMLSPTSILIASRFVPTGTDRPRANRLTWIDPATGRAVRTSSLAGLDDDEPRIGPMLSRGDRLWLWFGKSQHDPARDFVELIPSGPASAYPAKDPAHYAWQQRLPRELLESTALLDSPLMLFAAEAGDRTGVVAEAHGRNQLVGLRGSTTQPVIFAMPRSALSAGKKLRIEGARDGGFEGKLIIRSGDKVLSEVVVTDAAFADRWITTEVDLSAVSEGPEWITVEWLQTGGNASAWYLSKLQLIP